ncbi:MAG: hypothetical protein ACPGXX_16105 [Planctomycetaceae bacterium]
MKRVDFHSPGARLEDAFSELEAAWLSARSSWNDSVSHRVEDEYLIPLQGVIRSMLDAINSTSQKLQKAQENCQHPRERRSGPL